MDPIWIDANTLMRISEGDTALEGEILGMRRDGHQILVVPKVWEEATVGNPFRGNRPAPNVSTETAQSRQAAFNRIGAVLDMSGASKERLGPQFDVGLTAGQKGGMPSAKHESDFVVLAQVAASAKERGISTPTLFTLDAPLRGTFAPQWGVKGITRTSTPPARLTATVGEAEGLPTISGPNETIAGPLIMGAHAVIKSGLNQVSQRDAQDEAMAEYQAKEPAIRDMLRGNPGLGVRVDFYFTFQPGVNKDFNDVWIFDGVTFGPNPGAESPIAAPIVPRGERRHFTIVLEPDPKARRAAPAERTAQSVTPDLARLWNVSIGSWKGIFQFNADGSVFWAEGQKAQQHHGKWWVTGGQIRFEFFDDPPNNKRQWVIKSGLFLKVVTGFVMPEGVGGFFEMTRAEWWNANGS